MTVVPIETFKDIEAVSEKCHELREPICITREGFGDMVVMSAGAFERYDRALRYAAESTLAHQRELDQVVEDLRASEADIAAGRVRDAFEMIDELREKYCKKDCAAEHGPDSATCSTHLASCPEEDLWSYMTVFHSQTEFAYTAPREDGSVLVAIERTGDRGNASARCVIPGFTWSKIFGFTDDDMRELDECVRANAPLILEMAQELRPSE